MRQGICRQDRSNESEHQEGKQLIVFHIRYDCRLSSPGS
jgi:hypothetical protein